MYPLPSRVHSERDIDAGFAGIPKATLFALHGSAINIW